MCSFGCNSLIEPDMAEVGTGRSLQYSSTIYPAFTPPPINLYTHTAIQHTSGQAADMAVGVYKGWGKAGRWGSPAMSIITTCKPHVAYLKRK